VSKVEAYITDSLKGSSEKLLANKIPVIIKDQLPDDIDLDSILNIVDKKVPNHLLYGVDIIYVGNFKEFEDRGINAMYENGALYITNEQSNDKDMLDDIFHEIAHACEESYFSLIYSDGKIQDEFLGKRKKMFDILSQEGYNVSMGDFLNIDYSEEFDEFLHKEVGYEKLTFFTMGLFVSPYAATSYREYFANGFEHYFLEYPEYIKSTSPAVYEKVDGLVFMEI
tara:strand:- start:413 stop:1087 length:675 start_codon:yes stop_codon:yes gene_type:complete